MQILRLLFYSYYSQKGGIVVVREGSQVRGTNSMLVVMRSALRSLCLSFVKNSGSNEGNA